MNTRNIGELHLIPFVLTTIACFCFAFFLFTHLPFKALDGDREYREKTSDLSTIREAISEQVRYSKVISEKIAGHEELSHVMDDLRQQVEEMRNAQKSFSDRIEKCESTVTSLQSLGTRLDGLEKKGVKRK